MQIIIDFLIGIANFCASAFEYLVNTMQSTGEVLQMLVEFTANSPQYFSWLPSEYVAMIVIVFGVAVTYKILGREG